MLLPETLFFLLLTLQKLATTTTIMIAAASSRTPTVVAMPITIPEDDEVRVGTMKGGLLKSVNVLVKKVHVNLDLWLVIYS